MFQSFTQSLSKSLNTLSIKPSNLLTLSSVCLAFIGGLTLTLGVAANSSPSISSNPTLIAQTAKTTVVRIGHQKFDPLTLVKNKGDLEKRLKPLGVTEVKWTESYWRFSSCNCSSGGYSFCLCG